MSTFHYCDFRRGKYWHTYQSMESRLSTISRYILIDPDNNDIYSEELAEFLISIGSAIDTFFRNMSDCPGIKQHMTTLGIVKSSGDLNMTDYRDFSESYYELSSPTVSVPFGLGKSQDIHPFRQFKNNKSPDWWISYNRVKHDYHKNIKEAKLINVLNGLGGLLLLNTFHDCNQQYLFHLGIYQDQNGVLSIRDAENAFIFTPKGTTGYRDSGDFVFVRTNIFFFRFPNYEP